MKVNAISFMTFGNKSQIMKSAAVGMAGAAAGIAADTFVKGVSKPDNNIEEFVKANDGMGEENICFDYSACED